MKTKLHIAAVALALASVFGVAHADQLDDIKHAGKITIAVFDSNPPFGYVDAQSHQLAGYDIDIANEIARKLGVKLALQSTNPANRIPLLTSKKVNAIVADFTITPERAQQVDFSTPYFVDGQKFLAPKGKFVKKEQLAHAKIGAVKGTTEEQELRKDFPDARVLSYDEISLALVALRNGNVQAITQDGALLAGLLAKAPDKAKYAISPYSVSVEKIGVAVNKGEGRLLGKINQALVDLEKSGKAAKIYDKWFGKHSATPLPRTFRIVAP